MDNISDSTKTATERMESFKAAAGASVISLIQILPNLMKGFQGLGVMIRGAVYALGGLGPAALVVLALAAAATAAYFAFQDMYGEQLKLEKEIENMQAGYDALSQKVQETHDKIAGIQDAVNVYRDLTHQVYAATQGTEEYNKALEAANQSTMDMIDKYPDLMNFGDIFTRNANDLLEMNYSTVEKYLEQLKKTEDLQKVSSTLLGAQITEKQAKLTQVQLRDKINDNYKDYVQSQLNGTPLSNPSLRPQMRQLTPNVVTDADLEKLANLDTEDYNRELRNISQAFVNTGKMTVSQQDD